MEYVKETLDNGLRTIYVPMEGTQTVTVSVLVGVGSRYETKEINGISHFLEHMAFKGTEKRPDKVAIAQELDSVGAEFNAYTGQEYTVYWVKVDMQHTKLAVDVVSDIFLNSILPQKEIERERGVILGEIDMWGDSPTRQAWVTLNDLMLGDQPVGRTILGTKEVIRALSRDDFMRYREKFYKASNTVVVVAGNFEREKVKTLIQGYFKEMPRGVESDAERATWKQIAPQLLVGTNKFDQSHLRLGLWTADYHSEDRYPIQLLQTILGQGMSSRLFLRVREELGLGYYVNASAHLYDDYGIFEVSAGVDAERLSEAVQAIIHELVLIKNEGLEEKELRKALEFIKGRTRISLESSDEVGSFFGHSELEGGELLTPEQEFSKLEAVTPADVQRVAQEIFSDDRLNLAVVGPVKDEESVKKLLTFS